MRPLPYRPRIRTGLSSGLPMISRTARYALAAALGLTVLLVAGVFVLLGTSLSRPRLEAAASRALGLELSIAGGSTVRVFPSLLLTLEDVHARRHGVEIASVQQVTIGIALLSVLGGEPRVERVVLTQPVIHLVRDRAGRFNAEDPSPAAAPPQAALPEVLLAAGTVIFVDQRHGKGFEARDCQGEVRDLRRSAGPRADFLKNVSFTAAIACAQVRKEDITLRDLSFSAAAQGGIVDVKPLTTRLFGTQGAGTVRADFTGEVASYQLAYTLAQFPIEEFFAAVSAKKLATGRMDFQATLSTRGTTLRELKQALTGQASLRGQNLTFLGSDLDAAFDRFESSQTLNLVDLGAVFFAGPAGLLITKGRDFANLARGSGGSSEIRTLVSEWKVERGVAHARDVAFATRAHRVALHGGLDFVDEHFDAMSVALVDAKGCAIVQQRVRGSFQAPVVDKPNPVQALVGPAVRLLKKGSDLVFGDRCEVFYAGSVAPP